ncbi:MAG: hypothetical protein PHX77_01100 [Candidatus Bipolaricaulis sp.]|nr:hypothetical protein [Candidatus Bipolaricaulis sp.]
MFHVRLDSDGVCNYCRHWDQTSAFLLDFDRHRPLLEDRLRRFRGRFYYDAAVGLSGGKDSAYVLHRLTSGYDVRVLAVTFDNGFLTDSAWDNIHAITRRTGVDHFVYKPDWSPYREFYRAALLKLADPCFACSVGGYILSVRGCRDLRVPFFVHGRSPMQMFRHWYPGTHDPSVNVLRGNLAEYSPAALRQQRRTMLHLMRLLLLYLTPSPRLRHRMVRELFGSKVERGELSAEFLAFFLFEPYDEREIVRFLAGRDTGFRSGQSRALLGHNDCLIHDACAFLYEQQHGVPRSLLEVAAMVRQGAIPRDEADNVLAVNEPSPEALERSIGHLLERLEVSRAKFDALVARVGRKRGRLPLG